MHSLIDLIGNTPLVEIKKLNPNPKVRVFAKLEGQNPGGSVKDRAAYGMIKGALDRGDIQAGTRLVEATSGNTGIALAMIAAQFKIPITLVMPNSSTAERIGTMKAYGAEVLLTEGSIEQSRAIAEELSQKPDHYMLNQFANDDNWQMHFRTTGPEIFRDTDKAITHFVSSMGTTGTIMGTGRYLKSENAAIQIVGVQPMDGSRIPGIRRWSPEFLPKIYDASAVDRIIDVNQAQAERRMRELAAMEGIFCGVSSGGAMQAALTLAAELDEGLIVSIACDRGDRYLSQGFW